MPRKSGETWVRLSPEVTKRLEKIFPALLKQIGAPTLKPKHLVDILVNRAINREEELMEAENSEDGKCPQG